jgi:hypothetical protein
MLRLMICPMTQLFFSLSYNQGCHTDARVCAKEACLRASACREAAIIRWPSSFSRGIFLNIMGNSRSYSSGLSKMAIEPLVHLLRGAYCVPLHCLALVSRCEYFSRVRVRRWGSVSSRISSRSTMLLASYALAAAQLLRLVFVLLIYIIKHYYFKLT